MTTTTKKAGKEKTSTRIVPLGDRVVLKRADAEGKTKGGIVLPDTAKDKPQKGEVIAVGDGYIRDDGSRVPLTVKEGDDVIFSPTAARKSASARKSICCSARATFWRRSNKSRTPFDRALTASRLRESRL